MVAIAGADAHARLGFRSVGEPYDNGASLHVPAYEQLFRTFSNVVPGVSLTGDAAADANLVIDAIRSGHVYTAIDGMGSGGTLSFTATDGDTRAEPGDVISSRRELTLNVEIEGRPDALVQLFRDGVRTNEAVTRLKHETENRKPRRLPRRGFPPRRSGTTAHPVVAVESDLRRGTRAFDSRGALARVERRAAIRGRSRDGMVD